MTTKPQSTTEPSKSYREHLIEQLKTPEDAGGYLAASLSENTDCPDAIGLAIQDIIAAFKLPLQVNSFGTGRGEPVVDDNDAEPLTDAEVDAWLEAHKNDPVDPAQANRVEWLFRKKLAASIVDKAAEWLRSYDERIAQGGKGAQDMERLYGEEAVFHREVIHVVETLALEPPSVAGAVGVNNTGLHCNGCGLLIDGWPNVFRCVTPGCERIYHEQCLLKHCASDHVCPNCKEPYSPYRLKCDKCGAEAFDCCLSKSCKQCGGIVAAPVERSGKSIAERIRAEIEKLPADCWDGNISFEAINEAIDRVVTTEGAR